MQSVVDVLVGQIKRDDFAAVGVDANMEFAPGTALRGPMLFKQPFARAGATSAPCYRQSGAVRRLQFARDREPADRTLAGSAPYDRGPARGLVSGHEQR
jgi:hypothetical protein